MLYLISYDVSTEDRDGKNRLRKVAKVCENYGIRVQNSVFECVLTHVDYLHLRNELSHLINNDTDSLRFYPLGKNGREKVVHIGVNRGIDVEGALVL